MVLLQAGDLHEWQRYKNPLEILQTSDLGQVLPLLKQLEEAVERRGLYAAGFLSYQASPAFDPALKVPQGENTLPLLWFGLYDSFEQGPLSRFISPVDVEDLPADSWKPGISQQDYNQAIEQIKEYLKTGHSYQVNYTMPLKGPAFPSKEELLARFSRLIQRQQCSYGAWIDLGETQILSLSPELFFSQQGDSLECRPMKGTSPRGRWPEEDRRLADELHYSEKNRAENLMILDMIRNDMGRIALRGSVNFHSLYALEAYPTVWQMTSRASCRSRSSFKDILKSLFPCASITGAPKVRTMEIIQELEQCPRGIYTGSMGFLHPGGKRQFNVAIRSLVNDSRASHYHVGGGIVWDSTKEDEYSEALLKGRVLNRPPRDFKLLETFGWYPREGFRNLDRHLDRMAWSCGIFGYPMDRSQISRGLEDRAALWDAPRRCRLELDSRGNWNLQSWDWNPELPPKPRLGLHPDPVNSRWPMLYHKTDHRSIYEKRTLDKREFTLLQNEKGELTEFTIGNLVLILKGRPYTPPMDSGLLPGIQRGLLIQRGELEEKRLFPRDLERASEIYLINSLRGQVRVFIENGSHGY